MTDPLWARLCITAGAALIVASAAGMVVARAAIG